MIESVWRQGLHLLAYSHAGANMLATSLKVIHHCAWKVLGVEGQYDIAAWEQEIYIPLRRVESL